MSTSREDLGTTETDRSRSFGHASVHGSGADRRAGTDGGPGTSTAVGSWWPLVAYLLAVAAVAVLGSVATSSAVDGWYQDLDKPWFTPPRAVFGPVWTVLYVTIAVAAFLVHRARRPAGRALALWWVQLGLNLAWSLVFFGLRSPVGGLVVIVPLLLVILELIRRSWPICRAASVLLVPYAAWVTYATALNIGIVAGG